MVLPVPAPVLALLCMLLLSLVDLLVALRRRLGFPTSGVQSAPQILGRITFTVSLDSPFKINGKIFGTVTY